MATEVNEDERTTNLLVGFDSAWTPTNSGAASECSSLLKGNSENWVHRKS